LFEEPDLKLRGVLRLGEGGCGQGGEGESPPLGWGETPIDVLNRLQHVHDFAHVKGNGRITLEVTDSALKLLASSDERQVANERRDAIPAAIRREVWRRDEGKCRKCGSRVNLEYDHIIPVSKGGSNTVRNIELLCEACNRSKSDLIQ
jgi:hypothetical protein